MPAATGRTPPDGSEARRSTRGCSRDARMGSGVRACVRRDQRHHRRGERILTEAGPNATSVRAGMIGPVLRGHEVVSGQAGSFSGDASRRNRTELTPLPVQEARHPDAMAPSIPDRSFRETAPRLTRCHSDPRLMWYRLQVSPIVVRPCSARGRVLGACRFAPRHRTGMRRFEGIRRDFPPSTNWFRRRA